DRGAFDALIGDAEAALAETAAQHDTAVAALAQLVARDDLRARERARLAACRTTAAAITAASVGKWRDLLAALGELGLVRDAASSPVSSSARPSSPTRSRPCSRAGSRPRPTSRRWREAPGRCMRWSRRGSAMPSV